jgi:hypothetical protein
MVKITNISGRPLSRRTPAGNIIRWLEGATVEVTSKRLLEELDRSNGFARQEEIGKETGSGGLKTHVRPPKRRGRPPKSKPESKPKKEVKSKPKNLKKPKGLKKSKKGKTD